MAQVVEVPVPTTVADLNLFDRVDYEDAYQVKSGAQLSAEDWMRAFIEKAPRWFQVPWIGIGVTVLGARVGPLGGPDHVLGWKVLADRSDTFAVGLDSVGGLYARLIAIAAPDQATIATQIKLDSAWARTLWPGIRRGHRHFAPYLLHRAAQRVDPQTSLDRG